MKKLNIDIIHLLIVTLSLAAGCTIGMVLRLIMPR